MLDEPKASLARLQTDHVDLVQSHSVSAWADLEQALAPDRAVAGLLQAKEQGLTRFIGMTSHVRPEILAHAIKEFPFDTVVLALGMADCLVTSLDTVMGWSNNSEPTRVRY